MKTLENAPETEAERDRLKELNRELLAACKAFVEQYERATVRKLSSCSQVYLITKEAIAKAEGK